MSFTCALNVSYTLLCPSCGLVMFADKHEKHSNFAYWSCENALCKKTGKKYKQVLELIELEEI